MSRLVPSHSVSIPVAETEAERKALPPGTRYLVLPIVMSGTRSELSGRCHKRHLGTDVLQIGDYDSAAALFGGHTHKMAAEWWRCLQAEVSGPEAYQRALAAGLDGFPAEGYASGHTIDLMRLVTESYAKNASLSGGLPGNWELVSLEVRQTIEYAGVTLPFQMDRLLRNKDDGTHVLIDTKTSSYPGDDWKQQMAWSIQLRWYNWAGARYHGIDQIDHTVVEGIDKQGRVKTKGAVLYHWASMGWSPEYVQEAVDFVMRQAWRDKDFITAVWARYDQIRLDQHKVTRLPLTPKSDLDWATLRLAALEVLAEWPDFNYQDCHSYRVKCPFMKVCGANPGDRLGLLIGEYESVDKLWHLEAEG